MPLFFCLPDSETAGTARDYYLKFPGLEEELCYLLQLATRQDADEQEIIQKCRELVQTRSEELWNNFGTGTLSNEVEIDPEKIDYWVEHKGGEPSPIIPQQ